MNLTSRQREILAIVKKNHPISGDSIAEQLNLSKSTIRTDLAVLTMLGLLSAKPKVGYIYREAQPLALFDEHLFLANAKSLMSKATLIHESTSIKEASEIICQEDCESLFITNELENLVGVISYKKIIEILINDPKYLSKPISIIMTPIANSPVGFCHDTIYQLAETIQKHEIDSVPIVNEEQPRKVLGVISKTIIIDHYLNQNSRKES